MSKRYNLKLILWIYIYMMKFSDDPLFSPTTSAPGFVLFKY